MWGRNETMNNCFSRHPRVMLAVVCGIAFSLFAASAAMAAEGLEGYSVTQAEAEEQIAQELVLAGHGEDIQVNIIGRRGQDMVRRAVPVAMEIQALQADEGSRRFTATLAFSTEAALERPAQQLGNIAVSGRFEEMVEVPVVKYRLSAGDIIRDEDVEWQRMPNSRLRRETIRDAQELVGKSLLRGLSPNRPVLAAEVQTPPLVLRRMPVRMSYNTDVLSIQTVGTAMEDGALGDRIKVRNDDSGIEVDALVVSRGQVRVAPAIAFN